MENQEELNVYVVADNLSYAESLKRTLESDLSENIHVKTFNTKEASINEIDKSEVKPNIVVLDYKLNTKSADTGNETHTVDKIKEISPDTAVIIFSDEKDMPSASKALRYGANDYVLKDRFAHSHIRASVKKCLHPSKL